MQTTIFWKSQAGNRKGYLVVSDIYYPLTTVKTVHDISKFTTNQHEFLC